MERYQAPVDETLGTVSMNSESVVDSRDDLETLILQLMHSGASKEKMRWKEGEREYRDITSFFPKQKMTPKHCYLIDATDADEREYTGTMESIVVDPILAIGKRLEFAMVFPYHHELRWYGIAPIDKPRGLVALTNKPVKWFMIHQRAFDQNGKQLIYYKKGAAIDSDGKICKLRPLGNNGGFNPTEDALDSETMIALALSVFEDAHRKGAYHATVEEGIKVTFPVSEDAYKDFFLLRDGPNNTPTGRKNPILHWCSKHLRIRNDKIIEVTGHHRGTETLVVGPMTLTIGPNSDEGFLHWVKH